MSSPTRRTALLGLAAGATALLTACSGEDAGTDGATGSVDGLLTLDQVAAMEGRSLVDTLDALPLAERPSDFLASVRPAEVVLTDTDGSETAVSLSGEPFPLSVAPYVESTHECFHHSLTTCLGELGGQEMQVRVVDLDSEKVVLDEARTTHENGFLGLWLPRDGRCLLTLAQDGLSGEAEIGTSADDLTCLTSLHLT
ncbi:CueP family metal-binding protein [Brachybacterium squillarum]|uniref:CueP family metal-binding protein n=1 Tax=Brachybacterium squillarum TaxID=661979 RepID=UPI0002629813|nr:CueP family metal-binding protein [Brachybacterium squillarum]